MLVVSQSRYGRGAWFGVEAEVPEWARHGADVIVSHIPGVSHLNLSGSLGIIFRKTPSCLTRFNFLKS